MMFGEFQRIWKEAVATYCKVLLWHCLRGFKETYEKPLVARTCARM